MLTKYGFFLDYWKTVIITDKINHKSATEYPSHVDAYLAEEIEYGAMGGPYMEPSIEHLHVSPFMTQDKLSSDKL